jgi:hypothetical protein
LAATQCLGKIKIKINCRPRITRKNAEDLYRYSSCAGCSDARNASKLLRELRDIRGLL